MSILKSLQLFEFVVAIIEQEVLILTEISFVEHS